MLQAPALLPGAPKAPCCDPTFLTFTAIPHCHKELTQQAALGSKGLPKPAFSSQVQSHLRVDCEKPQKGLTKPSKWTLN